MKNFKKMPKRGLLACALVLSLVFGISASPAFAAYDDTAASSNSITGQQTPSSSDSVGQSGQESGTDFPETNPGEETIPDNDEGTEPIEDDNQEGADDEGGQGGFLATLGNVLGGEFNAMLNNSTVFFGMRSSTNPSKPYEKVKYDGTKAWKNQDGTSADGPIDDNVSSVTIKLEAFVDWGLPTQDENIAKSKEMSSVNGQLVTVGSDGLVKGDLNGDGQCGRDEDKYFDTNGDGVIQPEEGNASNSISLAYITMEKDIDSSDDWKYVFAVLDKCYCEYEGVQDSGSEDSGTFRMKEKDNSGGLITHPYKFRIAEQLESDNYEQKKSPEGEFEYASGGIIENVENRIVDFENRYLGDMKVERNYLAYEGAKHWMGVSDQENLPEVVMELRGTIGNVDVQDNLKGLYGANDDGSTNWDSPKEDLNGDGIVNDLDKYFDMNDDGFISDADKVLADDSDESEMKLVPIELPCLYRSATANAEGGWKYDFGEVPDKYYDFEVKSHAEGAEGASTTLVPRMEKDAQGNNRYVAYQYAYKVTEAELPEGYESFKSYIGEPDSNGATTTVDAYNYRMDKRGKIQIEKEFKGPIFVNTFKDENGEQKTNIGKNTRTSVFHIVGKMTDEETGQTITVYDDYASLQFTDCGSDTLSVSDLPLGAVYTISEYDYGGCGYTLDGIDPSGPFLLEAPQSESDEPETFIVKVTNSGTWEEAPNQGWINKYSPDGNTYKVEQIYGVKRLVK